MTAALDRREAIPDSIPGRMAATARPIKPVPFARVSHLAGVLGGVLAIAVFAHRVGVDRQDTGAVGLPRWEGEVPALRRSLGLIVAFLDAEPGSAKSLPAIR
jgi:hypothetical protein